MPDMVERVRPLVTREGRVPADPVSQTNVEFSEVVRSEAAFVLRLTRRLGVSDADVDDVAQEVFVILHRRLGDWDRTSPLRSFLFGIVRRTVANHRRGARRRPQGVDAPDLPSTDADPAQVLERSHERAILEQALGTLDDDKREVFVLYELEEMDMQDVAVMLQCSLKTAYSRLYAAREAVKREMRRALVTGRRP